ncbi:alkylation response protein AidB-like acyl-CoA dehydrogenase [Rathayibacter tanaceti]|uniref:Alkylation response protein AidB-like acyl-CoA dehydrogenase n=2 Tax=Rathayibacter tanaceti TaxID=1671680 RepID=A0ACD2XJZ8_9MICO|nr:acyl-CoA dehydrogenase family protein [Rathayibacter tanaceti]QHC54807.1 acyl-CoA dehydrogenase [Rathayibacter tanaceti]TCO37370.1 alkylation response protein AidB-like acyl-CoA dehydrogenase [Rathayibacter tanaceti]
MDPHAPASLPASLPDDVAGALALARTLSTDAPRPGTGRTAELHALLQRLARHDLGVARTVEPHLDALGILGEAGLTTDDLGLASDTAWGVFAAEGGDEPLVARREGGTWRLDGVKPWCSLADRLDAALVTAPAGDASGERLLFAVPLREGTALPVDGAWHARGLAEVPSGPVRFSGARAEPVGAPGWYLSRPGFAWGGIGVAACWHGGALGVASAVAVAAARRDDPHLLAQLGSVDTALSASRRALDEAAAAIDAGRADGVSGSLLAKRVRASVAGAVEEILVRAGRALGPAPLALDAEHSKRVADLTLYVRQHHAERDDAALGRAVLASGAADRW